MASDTAHLVPHLDYAVDRAPTTGEFVDLLERSGLAARRPVDRPARIAAMVEHADLWATAWDAERLVGVARSVTDFGYCCYLSDLAVDEAYRGHGIGRRLIELTREAAGGDDTVLVLLATPAAHTFYGHIGLELSHRCWTIPKGRRWPPG